MKSIEIIITISEKGKRIAATKSVKTAPDDEIEVLASAINTLFIKSKDALKIAARRIKKSS